MRWTGCLLAGIMLCALPAAALDMPTLALRQEAREAAARGDGEAAEAALRKAEGIAHAQADPYVAANELRYIAEAWARAGHAQRARETFAEAMAAAGRIPTWNHRLYASIGVVESQRGTGDGEGAHRNGMAALDGGLLEAVAASGGAAEMGRFLTALDGLLTQDDRAELERRILRTGDGEFRRKALHALGRVTLRATE